MPKAIKQITLYDDDTAKVVSLVAPAPVPVPDPQPQPEPQPEPQPPPTPPVTPPDSSIPADAKSLAAGASLSGLTGGYRLDGLAYSASGTLKDGLKLYGAQPGIVLTVPTGKQLFLGKNSVLQNITVRGGGIGKGNHQAALTTDDGCVLIGVTVEKANGVGLCIKGDSVVLANVTCQDNDASGMGGNSASNFRCAGVKLLRNNFVIKDHDGGGGKFLRTSGATFIDFTSEGNCGAGIWFDYRNKGVTFKGGRIANQKHWTQSGAGFDVNGTGRGLYIEWNAKEGGGGGNFLIEGMTFDGNDGAGAEVAESQDITFRGNTFKPSNPALTLKTAGLQFRDISRTEAGKPFTKVLQRITLDGNTFDGTNVQGTKDGGTNVTKSRNNIKVLASNQWLNGASDKVPA